MISRNEISIDCLYDDSFLQRIETSDDEEDKEVYRCSVIYEYDSCRTSSYIFFVDIDTERPRWTKLLKTAEFSAYSVLLAGGEFECIEYPGCVVTRDLEALKMLH